MAVVDCKPCNHASMHELITACIFADCQAENDPWLDRVGCTIAHESWPYGHAAHEGLSADPRCSAFGIHTGLWSSADRQVQGTFQAPCCHLKCWLKPFLRLLPAQKHVGWLLCRALTAIVQVMMVLMHNTREVPAEWQVKPPVDPAGAADWSYFKCEPEQGLLPPGQKQLLKVCPTILLAR